jgi:vancomycin resistance protein YoaR
LEQRFDRVAHVPVVFTAGGQRYPIKATTLSVEADWAAAIENAARQGEGFGPVRGFRRLQARFFGAEISPPVQAYAAALDFKVAGLAQSIDQSHVEAKLVRRGLAIEVVAGQPGRELDQKAAGARIVRALARLERGQPVALPVRIDPVEVTAADLAPAASQARIALSAPVRLKYEETRWKLPRWRIAELLSLPVAGETDIAIAGPGAEAWFDKLRKNIEHTPVDAGFAVNPGGIDIIPDEPGLGIDVPATAKALLAAATSPTARTAELAVRATTAERTTADASAMGITGVVGSYYTTYGGIPSRLHNVALVAQLIDGALIAPGKTFSFNGTTGERTAEKGFQEAPVIINGELQTGLGGGICQVSTTVFNAAYEAGLEIDERTNHALYISHYPLGRDATVNYPDQDLKFTNDTDHWLLLRTFVGSGSLTVNLYGTPQNRRVETATQPLRVVGAPRVKRVPDPKLLKGKSEVEEYGQPARATSVNRTVYDADGAVLHEDTWYSSYRSEPKVVRVGTKPKPKPKTKPPVGAIPDAPPASNPLP